MKKKKKKKNHRKNAVENGNKLNSLLGTFRLNVYFIWLNKIKDLV